MFEIRALDYTVYLALLLLLLLSAALLCRRPRARGLALSLAVSENKSSFGADLRDGDIDTVVVAAVAIVVVIAAAHVMSAFAAAGRVVSTVGAEERADGSRRQRILVRLPVALAGHHGAADEVFSRHQRPLL